MNWVAPIKDQETLKNFGETLKQVLEQDSSSRTFLHSRTKM